MTRVALIEALKQLCEEAVKDMDLPLSLQKGDEKIQTKIPEVYRQRLPSSNSAKKLAPYIIVQLIDSKQLLLAKETTPRYTATVRLICCVQCDDESIGGVMLLNLLDRLQIHILKQTKIGKCFVLDVNEPFEALMYPDDTAPYFLGELIGTFQLPPIQQEVDFSFENKK